MPATPVPDHRPGDLRRIVDRLEALPMRPASARLVLSRSEEDDPGPDPTVEASRPPLSVETDPAWALVRSRAGPRTVDPLATLAEHPWWPASSSTGPAAEALGRLWRLSNAVAFAARRLAREADLGDPEAVARAGLLHGLGLWAVASVEPARLTEWFATPDPAARREIERRWLGTEASSLGRQLAVRWGCEPLVVDAAWLHADLGGDLDRCAHDPDRLALIQQAFALARRTPWAPAPEDSREPGPGDPRVKILTAEVQSRCGGVFIDPDASPREEKLTRDNARLRLSVARLRVEHASQERFVRAVAESSPTESPEAWADRAGLALCGEPGIAAARVDWAGAETSDPGSISLPLGDPARPCAMVHLRPVDRQGHSGVAGREMTPSAARVLGQKPPSGGVSPPPQPSPTRGEGFTLTPSPLVGEGRGGGSNDIAEGRREDTARVEGASIVESALLLPTLGAWDAWARAIDERVRLRQLLDEVLSAHRGRVDREEPARRRAMFDALAEFAAGAGHELNNPLAVIVGRAQLLMAREDDPEAIRSFRAIIAQAQRAHRILRDLMYVARPPEPRPRPCQPEEIVRACLRDLQAEAEARGVRIVAEAREPASRVWADPDPLRQLADILARNALEATPAGGSVLFTAGSDGRTLRWSVHDTGRGIGATEGLHLFDPFYCGRQAGRGLGLGLPRAARIVEQVGGDLRWQSVPGHGTTFQVSLPVGEIPQGPEEERPGGSKTHRALPGR